MAENLRRKNPVLIEHYNLNKEEQAELFEAVEQSKKQVEISLFYANNSQRKSAVHELSFISCKKDFVNLIQNIFKNYEI